MSGCCLKQMGVSQGRSELGQQGFQVLVVGLVDLRESRGGQ